MRPLALTALLLAAVSWMGTDGAVAQKRDYHAVHTNSSTYRHAPNTAASPRYRRGYQTTNHFRWHPQSPTRYGANSVAPPPPRGDGPPRYPRPPRWPRPPIVTHPVGPTGGPVIVNAPIVNAPIVNTPSSNPNIGGPITPPGQGGRNPTAANNQRFVPDEVLVRFNGGTSTGAIANFTRANGLVLLGTHPLPLINAALYQFRITDRRTVPAVLAGMRGDARLASAQPNFLYVLRDSGPRVDGAPDQYAAIKMHLAQAHALARGNGVLIALIDAGVDATHAELRGSIAQGLDAVKGAVRPHAHGTAMASAIIAHGRLMGVAPAARIVAIRAFDGDGDSAQSTSVRLLDSLQWASTSGARVINMSFSGQSDAQLQAMVAALRQKGLVLVAAAGNDGPGAAPDYPAAYPGVIAVTAIDADDHLLGVANRGSYIAVAAPGVEIVVAKPNGGYGFSTGTSIAAAHVSGLVALLLERNPRLTPDAIAAILMRTAKHLGPKDRDDEFGAGLIDAYAAVMTQTEATATHTSAR